LLERLTPERRRIMQPMPPLHTGDPRVPVDLHSTYQFRTEDAVDGGDSTTS
jgi:hypothetical protein